MKFLISLIVIIVSSMTQVMSQDSNLQTIIVKVVNFKSDNGKALVALYNSEATFLGKGYKSTKSVIDNKTCTVTFTNVPQGIYAISLFHDVNDNNKMDTNFIGIPKEDYACSNNAKGFMGEPKWKDAQFEVKNETLTLTIKI
jgi:uncharacterized protein (DUF2141 family)